MTEEILSNEHKDLVIKPEALLISVGSEKNLITEDNEMQESKNPNDSNRESNKGRSKKGSTKTIFTIGL